MNTSSMSYWLPLVCHLADSGDVNIPVTWLYREPIDGLLMRWFYMDADPKSEPAWSGADGEAWSKYNQRLYDEAVAKFGFPLFMRTDQTSNKHRWRNSCFVDRTGYDLTGHVLWKDRDPTQLEFNRHLAELLECHAMNDFLGLEAPNAIVLREYIPLATNFVAFSGALPIGWERRYFVRNGTVECHHPYWPEAAVGEGSPSRKDWQLVLAAMNTEEPDEVRMLSQMATKLGISIPAITQRARRLSARVSEGMEYEIL